MLLVSWLTVVCHLKTTLIRLFWKLLQRCGVHIRGFVNRNITTALFAEFDETVGSCVDDDGPVSARW
jgi:hypothetical protein